MLRWCTEGGGAEGVKVCPPSGIRRGLKTRGRMTGCAQACLPHKKSDGSWVTATEEGGLGASRGRQRRRGFLGRPGPCDEKRQLGAGVLGMHACKRQ